MGEISILSELSLQQCVVRQRGHKCTTDNKYVRQTVHKPNHGLPSIIIVSKLLFFSFFNRGARRQSINCYLPHISLWSEDAFLFHRGSAFNLYLSLRLHWGDKSPELRRSWNNWPQRSAMITPVLSLNWNQYVIFYIVLHLARLAEAAARNGRFTPRWLICQYRYLNIYRPGAETLEKYNRVQMTCTQGKSNAVFIFAAKCILSVQNWARPSRWILTNLWPSSS